MKDTLKTKKNALKMTKFGYYALIIDLVILIIETIYGFIIKDYDYWNIVDIILVFCGVIWFKKMIKQAEKAIDEKSKKTKPSTKTKTKSKAKPNNK